MKQLLFNEQLIFSMNWIQVLIIWTCSDKAATTQPLDLRDIPKGVYVIRLLQGDRNYTQTIVKQ